MRTSSGATCVPPRKIPEPGAVHQDAKVKGSEVEWGTEVEVKGVGAEKVARKPMTNLSEEAISVRWRSPPCLPPTC